MSKRIDVIYVPKYPWSKSIHVGVKPEPEYFEHGNKVDADRKELVDELISQGWSLKGTIEVYCPRHNNTMSLYFLSREVERKEDGTTNDS